MWVGLLRITVAVLRRLWVGLLWIAVTVLRLLRIGLLGITVTILRLLWIGLLRITITVLRLLWVRLLRVTVTVLRLLWVRLLRITVTVLRLLWVGLLRSWIGGLLRILLFHNDSFLRCLLCIFSISYCSIFQSIRQDSLHSLSRKKAGLLYAYGDASSYTDAFCCMPVYNR